MLEHGTESRKHWPVVLIVTRGILPTIKPERAVSETNVIMYKSATFHFGYRTKLLFNIFHVRFKTDFKIKTIHPNINYLGENPFSQLILSTYRIQYD